MQLHSLTLDQFLCTQNLSIAEADANTFHFHAPLFKHLVGPKVRTLNYGYDLHQLGPFLGDIALLYKGQLAGFYHSQVLAIDPGHASKQLSVPLILAAVPHRALPTARLLSPAGRVALERAWEVANDLRTNPWP